MRKDRKKEHRKIVKFMRKQNDVLAHDDYLGRGRFRIDMYSEDWSPYGDGSGGYMRVLFKMKDTWYGNSAMFYTNNYGYDYFVFNYLNDFLIRCSSGHMGHWPALHYAAYDVHTIVPYKKEKIKEVKVDEDVVCSYNYLRRKSD